MGAPATKPTDAAVAALHTGDHDAEGDRMTGRQSGPDRPDRSGRPNELDRLDWLNVQMGGLREAVHVNRRDIGDLRQQVREGFREAAAERKRVEREAAAERKRIETALRKELADGLREAAAERKRIEERAAAERAALREELVDLKEVVLEIRAQNRAMLEREAHRRKFEVGVGVAVAAGLALLVVGSFLRPVLERLIAALLGGG